VPSGLHLSTIGQCSFICSYVMLMVLARLQRLDRSLEEAALDLGASHAQALRLIVLPYLRPSLLTAAVIAFFQSFENFNTTLFTRGGANTVTIFIASRIRTGVTPEVNALGLVLISITITAAVIYTIRRQRGGATA
jgi:spermidine/putrescine transport system permease protein